MLGRHALTAATTADWVTAGAALAVALLLAFAVRVLFRRRARRVAAKVLGGRFTAEADTRLRLIERLLEAVIIVAGIAIALSKFEEVRVIGRTLLTSGAIAAAILGFAARQTLANVVAGVLIAIAQPLRLGDHVGIEDDRGVVEDVTLSYTILRTGGGTRIVIPNEKLAASVLHNDSLVDEPVALDVSVWIAPDADAGRAVEILQAETGGAVTVAEAAADGVRLAVGGESVPPGARAGLEADLRLRCLRRLHAEGLLPHA
jgi:small-conductance mechanosensitive channel